MQRASRIGLKPKELAALAGISFVTIYRGLQKPGSTSSGNLQALGQALLARELELRDYLNRLHPPAEDGGVNHSHAAE